VVWNTTPIWRRMRDLRARTVEVFCPLMITAPRVGRSMSAISLSSVLLPAPSGQ